MRPSMQLGQDGEDLAAAHLTAAGMEVLARNWRCREGELDIVAREPSGAIVFVEVKARSGTRFGEPAEAVGRVKARRIHVLACRWLAENRPSDSPALRFDVVSVVRRRGFAPEIQHLRGAF